MTIIKKNTNIQFARLVSFEFRKDNPEIKSIFFSSKTCDKKYNLFSVLAFSDNGNLIGGVNGNLKESEFRLDEIWVKPEFRDLWVGRKMLLYVKENLISAGYSCFYYPHLICLENYLKMNLFSVSADTGNKTKKRGKEIG